MPPIQECNRLYCVSADRSMAPQFRGPSSRTCIACQQEGRAAALQRRTVLGNAAARAVVPIEEAHEMADAYVKGASLQALADRFRRGRSTVYRTLRAMNVVLRPARVPTRQTATLTGRVAVLEAKVRDLTQMLDILDARTRKQITQAVPATTREQRQAIRPTVRVEPSETTTTVRVA